MHRRSIYHRAPDRIVSVSQPFVYPIVQGNASKLVKLCIELDISVVDGWTWSGYCSFDTYNEAGNLKDMIERFYQRERFYPARILMDRVYRTRENPTYCKAHKIGLSSSVLG